ncbi:unnamed protein product [Cylicocyclus nassatus]|uniref:AB hydrolase-1 domain-containing protein n=1 Tax=Cylicocyclus nassatus TaxID=53992 RepID=A0AA36M9Y2_CYLNA|nr:unnamed protein product [Cylicocyclus nassatus]
MAEAEEKQLPSTSSSEPKLEKNLALATSTLVIRSVEYVDETQPSAQLKYEKMKEELKPSLAVPTNLSNERKKNELRLLKKEEIPNTDVTQESSLEPSSSVFTFGAEEIKKFKKSKKKSTSEQTTESDFEMWTSGKTSLRARFVHAKSRTSSIMDDRTVRGERDFLRTIEKHKHRRLERLCICPVTKWLLFKERMGRLNNILVRVKRFFWILCCPPLCYILPQVAFWPPPNEYFFYIDNGPPRIRKEIEGHQEAVEIALRKKKFDKVFRADKKTTEHSGWRIGHVHPCADDIDDVEAFVVKTMKKNYIACVRIRAPGVSRYSILYSHPNASDLSDHLLGVPNLSDIARFHKCDVYSYDYSGYGISTGHPSESNQKADIRAVYDHLVNERDLLSKDIVLLGYSIGCFATVHLACAISEPPAGIILQAPPTSLLRVLFWERACFKKPFKTHSCCADRFSIYEQICNVRVPVLVIHGEDDRTVPVAHGRAICERAVKRVPPLWLRATHDNIENCRDTWLRIRTFIKYELKNKPDEEASTGEVRL